MKSLEALSQALVEGAAAASKVIFLVSPSSTTKPKTIADAGNGAIVQGRPEDVAVIQVGKTADFSTAAQMTQTLERRIGSKKFLTLFIVSGIVGNIGYLTTAYISNNTFVPAIGASGAVYGVVGALAILYPRMPVLIYGIIPMPMIVTAFLYVMIDFFGLFMPTGVAHGAHIGGMIVGIIFAIIERTNVRINMNEV